jgi:hypothetical protein
MSDDVKQAIAELNGLVVCRCSPAYTGRKLRDPDCHCGYAPEVKAVADHIQELEAKLGKAVAALNGMVKECEAELLPSHGYIKYFCCKTLAEIEGEN